MNSIRPLATITLLACAGVFLYMKINQSEPVLPEELGEWSNTLDVDANLGGSFAGADEGASVDGSDPFASTTFESTPQASGPSGGAAPSWSPPPATESQQSHDRHTAAEPTLRRNEATDPDAMLQATESIPEMPEMPELPPMNDESSADSSLDAAEAYAPAEQPQTQNGEPNYEAANPVTPAAAHAAPTSPQSTFPNKSTYSAARTDINAALDRGELSKALLLITEWYGDPSLTPPEAAEVETLLSQLAGTVIYSREPRLEPPYIVRAGENLQDVANKYNVPWELLAKINGITQPGALEAGQELKVVKGPFSATVDLSRRELTLMLDRRYAGRFPIQFDPQTTVEEGVWTVDQKLLTPSGGGLYGAADADRTEDRSLLLTSPAAADGQVAVLRGPESSDPITATPASRVIRLKPSEVEDVFDILSVGSQVIIRR